MKKVFLILSVLMFGISGLAQDGDGQCCDPDMTDYIADEGFCSAVQGAPSPVNCTNDEPLDCNVGELVPACTIPIDGGLSLLALAGGGLATAAMRRRREEEEAATQSAA